MMSSLGVRLGGVYGCYFLFIGLLTPYWPMWLQSHGVGIASIGWLVAATQFFKVTTSPLIAQISDQTGRRREILVGAALLSVATFGLFGLTGSMLGLFLVTALLHCFLPAILPLTEVMALSAARRGVLDYGRTRAIGSVTFILVAYVGGVVIAASSVGSIFWMMWGSLALTAGAVFFLPRDSLARDSLAREGGATQRPAAGRFSLTLILGLLRDPGFLRMIATVSLLHASHAVLYVSGSLHWQANGISTDMIGALWALGVVAEILLFVTAGRWIGRWKLSHILMWTGALTAIRWALMAVTLDLRLLFLIQILHGVSYGVTHLAAMQYLSRAVPEGRAATAQALYSAIPMGLAFGAALALSGSLYVAFGGAAYFVMSGLAGLAVVTARGLRAPQPQAA